MAHRGSSARAPENTFAAFDRAVEDGADAIELDVRLSGENELVVCHDSTIDRCSEGTGRVSALTVPELKQFSAGAWFSKAFSAERIPTLAEVFERYADRIAINVEFKADRSENNILLVDRCCRLIESFRLRDTILITSFHHSLVTRLKQLRSNIPAGLLLNPVHILKWSPRTLASRFGVGYLVVGGGSLRKSFVEDAHRCGLKVGEFTVNTERRMKRAIRFGLDTVITDDPLTMKKAR